MEEMRKDDRLAKGTRGQLISRGVIGGEKKDPPIEKTLEEYGIDKNLAKQARKAVASLRPRQRQACVSAYGILPLLIAISLNKLPVVRAPRGRSRIARPL